MKKLLILLIIIIGLSSCFSNGLYKHQQKQQKTHYNRK